MNKPIVHYIPDSMDRIVEGQAALIIHPIDHPTLSNKCAALTSRVLNIHHNGFETQKSIYRIQVEVD